ncbi:MAG: hypothetical protein WDZ47_01165 [Bacteroidales bacterium]
MDELRKFRSNLDWSLLALNEKLPWSLELFKEFDNELTMHEGTLSKEDIEEISSMGCKLGDYHANININRGIPWTVEMIDYVKDKISWLQLNYFWPLEKSGEMLERYQDYIDWTFPQCQWQPEWTPELVKKFAHKLDIKRMTRQLFKLSLNDSYIKDLLMKHNPDGYIASWLQNEKRPPVNEQYLKKMQYKHSLKLGSIKTTPEDILYALENFSTETLPYVDIIEWTPELIDYLSDRPDWNELCIHNELPFTEALIEKHIDKVEFGRITEEGYIKSGLSSNHKLPWSIVFIRKYEDKWDWRELGLNKSLPWSEELILAFLDKWDWTTLAYGPENFWTIERIKKYKDKIDWTYMSDANLIFTPALLEAFEENWNYEALAENEEFIEQVLEPLLSKETVEEFIQTYL